MSVALVLFVALFAIGVDNYIIAAILPQIADDLGVAIAIVGLLASAYALPNALLAPVFGPFSDRYGRKVMMVGGMGLFLIAVVASALAPSFPLLLGARVLNGLGAALVLPAAFAYVSDGTSPSERPRAISTLFTAYPSSTLVGVPLGGFAAAALGWRAAFWVVGVMALVALLLLMTLASDRTRPGAVLGYLESLQRVITSRRAVGALSVTVLWFAAALGLFTYVGEFFTRTYGLPVNQVSLIFMIVGVMGILATRLGGRFIGALGAKRAVMFGIGAFATAAFVLPLTAGLLPVSLLVIALWVFGTWFGLPAQQTLISGLQSDTRGTLLAFNSSALYLGGVVGPAIAGTVLGLGGFRLLGPWSSALALAALTLAWAVLPSDERLREVAV